MRDRKRAEALGYEVQGYSKDDGSRVLSLMNGQHDGELIRLRASYKLNPKSREFVFAGGLVHWPVLMVHHPINSTKRFWDLAEKYAPKTED